MTNASIVLSLALCPAAAVMWVRSFLVYEQVGRITPDHGADIVRSASGRIHFARHSYWDHIFSHTGRWEHHVGVQAPDQWPQYEYQRPVDEVLGFARYVGTAYTWHGHVHGVPDPLPPRSDPRWVRDHYAVWVVPHWFLVIVTGALPAVWLARHPPSSWVSPLACRRRAKGLCAACGYDLRASPVRCPECGAAARGDGARGDGAAADSGGTTARA